MAASFTVLAELSGVGGGFTDITADIANLGMRTQRMFQSTRPDDLIMAPGIWTWAMNNTAHNSGTLLSYYSPDSSNCRSGWGEGIRVKLTITANGTTRTKFFGWIDQIAPAAGLYGGDQTVAVQAVGWLAYAATTGISSLATAVLQRGDQLVTTLTALVTFPPVATQFATGLDIYPYAFDDLSPDQSTVLDGCDSIMRSGFDRFWEKSDGTLVYENRQTREAFQTPVATWTDVAPGGFPSIAIVDGGLSASRKRLSMLNRFQVTTHPRNVDSSPVVLFSMPVAATDTPLQPGQTISFQVPYVDPNQPGQSIGAFNTLIDNGSGGSMIGASGSLPSGDFHFTDAPLGAGSNLTSDIAVTVVFGTTQATLTLVSSASEAAYYSLLQGRGQGLYNYRAAIGVKTADASIAVSGQNTLTIDCPYQANPFFAAAAAAWCAAVFSPNVTQIDQGPSFFVPADDEVSMDALLQREISDPVEVKETVTGLDGTFWINGETMDIDERCNILFTYNLAPMPISVGGWRVNVPGQGELGVTTTVAYF